MSIKNFVNKLLGKDGDIDGSNDKVENILAPFSGEVIKLEDLDDPAFSQKMIGDGLAIRPSHGELVSPVDGKVSMVFETSHAIGISSDKGVDILIHVGMDTVELKGKGFKSYVKNGDIIKAGEKLMDVDLDVIRKAGYETATPIVITNHTDLGELEKTSSPSVSKNDEFLKISL